MQIFLIRHPEPAVAPSVCYGKTDIALSEQALAQLDTLALALKQQLPTGIPVYCSPLTRCRLLADRLHAQPVPDDRLMEMDFGHWEMQPWDHVPRAQINTWAAAPLDFVIPGGESVARLQQRVMAFMQEQRQLPALALVTHAGVMRVLAGAAGKLPPHEWLALRFKHGIPYRIDWHDQTPL